MLHDEASSASGIFWSRFRAISHFPPFSQALMTALKAMSSFQTWELCVSSDMNWELSFMGSNSKLCNWTYFNATDFFESEKKKNRRVMSRSWNIGNSQVKASPLCKKHVTTLKLKSVAAKQSCGTPEPAVGATSENKLKESGRWENWENWENCISSAHITSSQWPALLWHLPKQLQRTLPLKGLQDIHSFDGSSSLKNNPKHQKHMPMPLQPAAWFVYFFQRQLRGVHIEEGHNQSFDASITFIWVKIAAENT